MLTGKKVKYKKENYYYTNCLLQVCLYFLFLHLLPLPPPRLFFVLMKLLLSLLLLLLLLLLLFSFFLLLFLTLHLDFFFCQQKLTFIVKTDKGIELDCFIVVQFSWVKGSQVEASVEFVFGLPHGTNYNIFLVSKAS